MREPLPPVLILTPVRNGAAFLPRYSRQEAVEPAAAFGHEFPGQDPGIRPHPAIIRPGRPVWTHRPPRLPSLTGSSRLKQCR